MSINQNTLFLEKFNNYICQCISEIVNHSEEYYRKGNNFEEEEDSNELDINKKYYINNINLSLKKLLNNTESIFSHSKFELINNCITNCNKLNKINDKNILDLLGSIKSEYNSDDNNESDNESENDDGNNSTYLESINSIKSGGCEENNIFCEDNGSDLEKTDNDGEESDEESANEEDAEEENAEEDVHDTVSVDTGVDNVQYDSCIARKKRKEKYLPDSAIPSYHFKDMDGYIYGHQCHETIYKDNLCEKHFKKLSEKGTIELITGPPIKFENKNKNDTSDTESTITSKSKEKITTIPYKNLSPDMLSNSSVESSDLLKVIKIKRKNFYIDEETGTLYDYNKKSVVGMRIRSNKKGKTYDYIMH